MRRLFCIGCRWGYPRTSTPNPQGIKFDNSCLHLPQVWHRFLVDSFCHNPHNLRSTGSDSTSLPQYLLCVTFQYVEAVLLRTLPGGSSRLCLSCWERSRTFNMERCSKEHTTMDLKNGGERNCPPTHFLEVWRCSSFVVKYLLLQRAASQSIVSWMQDISTLFLLAPICTLMRRSCLPRNTFYLLQHLLGRFALSLLVVFGHCHHVDSMGLSFRWLHFAGSYRVHQLGWQCSNCRQWYARRYCWLIVKNWEPLRANLRLLMHFAIVDLRLPHWLLVVMFNSSVTSSVLSPCLCRRLQAL